MSSLTPQPLTPQPPRAGDGYGHAAFAKLGLGLHLVGVLRFDDIDLLGADVDVALGCEYVAAGLFKAATARY
jgi:hypothetical protein